MPPFSPHGHFDPMMAHAYTVDQIIEFMRNDGLTIQEIHTAFDMNMLSHDDYLKMLAAEVCSIEDLIAIDVPRKTIELLKEKQFIISIQRNQWELVRNSSDPAVLQQFIDNFPATPYTQLARQRLAVLTDEADWKEARSLRTLEAYSSYLIDHPEGIHVDEAKKRIHTLQTEEAEITRDLIEDMRKRPWVYSPSLMANLLDGNGPLTPGALRPEDDDDLPPHMRFLSRGLRLRFKTLTDNGVIPPSITENMVRNPEFSLPQTQDFSTFPLDRTDVFFLGVPRSGKSTVLSSLFYSMFREGRWRHVMNLDRRTGSDPSLLYYQGLLKAVHAHKPPESTAKDTISYISMDVPVKKEQKAGTARLNFVEISGEAVHNLAESIAAGTGSNVVWDRLGASQILRNDNKKILFFLLDYKTIIDDTVGTLDQELTLTSALNVLYNDGPGKNRTQKCTLSKVESVAILLTKADLMDTEIPEERLTKAMDYLQSNFQSFMNTLTEHCRRFDINHNNQNRPLVFTFSAGRFYIGNTLEFDNKDAKALARRIEMLAPYVS